MKKSESAAVGSKLPCPKNSYWAIDGLLLAATTRPRRGT